MTEDVIREAFRLGAIAMRHDVAEHLRGLGHADLALTVVVLPLPVREGIGPDALTREPEIELVTGFGPEMRRALEQAGGWTYDRDTRTATIRGGPFDGARFRPDAAGVFQPVPPGD